MQIIGSSKSDSLHSAVDRLSILDALTQDAGLGAMEPMEREIFQVRYNVHFADVVRPLLELYGHRPDFADQLERFFAIVARAYRARSRELRRLDLQRTSEPDWFQQSGMVGYVCYVDRLAGTLEGVADRISYLKELGVTYLHLMPLLKPRPGNNDGGYAVMDYREVADKVGTMGDLHELASSLQQEGISLCIDLVCNHTAKEHEWAQKARAGNAKYRDYYLTYPDRSLPEQFERTLPEVFPAFAPGNFSYDEELERWVWTTFNDYQWDLNYANPDVFGEMLDVMLFLANQGISVLRLDAVAFMWKRLGTDSQNQPEVHSLLQAFRALTRIAAPALIFKAEAIVSPDRLLPYLGQGLGAGKECEIAYHNSFMVLLWSSLAERRVTLMAHALQQMPDCPPNSAWVTYARCHDDIGWAIRDEDASAVGLSGELHRAFLSDFYSGKFPDSFARGETFQFNPKTGDRRISGSLASLAGLSLAFESRNQHLADLAVRRILLLYNMLFVFDGIPLIYMGDEIGLTNDLSYLQVSELADDNRWMHRPWMDWDKAEERADSESVSGRIYHGIRRLVTARQQTPTLHCQAGCYAVQTNNERVFGLLRNSARGRLLVLSNFNEFPETVPRWRIQQLGLRGTLQDTLSGTQQDNFGDIRLQAYQSLWLEQLDTTKKA
jgi:amylosucrase